MTNYKTYFCIPLHGYKTSISVIYGPTDRNLVWHGKLRLPGYLYSFQLKPCNYIDSNFQLSAVQFSRSVVSDSLWPHESQHSRPPCPSPIPRVHSDSHPSSQWCHPAISSSVIPFSSCPQSLPAPKSFLVSQLFTWGGQSIQWAYSYINFCFLWISSWLWNC